MSTALTPIVTGHIGLNVSDLERSIRFYQTALGFDLLRRSEVADRRFAFLGVDSAVVLTLWQQSDGVFPVDRPGLHHLAFRAASRDEVAGAEQRLRALGARIHHGGIVPHAEGADSGGLFFEDPDGIRLEIFTASGVAGTPAPHADGPTCGFF
jgi:lactoylglutathione lyase